MSGPARPIRRDAVVSIADTARKGVGGALGRAPRELIEAPFLRRMRGPLAGSGIGLLELSVAGFETDPLGAHADERLQNISSFLSGLNESEAGLACDAVGRIAASVGKLENQETRRLAALKALRFMETISGNGAGGYVAAAISSGSAVLRASLIDGGAMEAHPILDAAHEASAEFHEEVITAVTDPEEQQRMLDKTMLKAAASGDWERMKDALAAGAHINAKDGDGWTALAHASYTGNVKEIDFLIDNGADKDLADKVGRTPLIHACRADKTKSVAALLKRKPDVNARSTFKETALTVALAKGNDEVARMLTENGAKSEKELAEERLFRAALGGDLEGVVKAIDEGADPDARGPGGMRALMFAAGNDHAPVVRYLLSKGVDPYAMNERKEDAVGLAGEETQKEIIAFLEEERGKHGLGRKEKAAEQAKGHDERTKLDIELHIAVVMGFTSLVGEKLDKGALIDSKDELEHTPLMQSIIFNDFETFNLLLSRKPDLEARDNHGWTALKHAAAEGRTEFMEALAAAGAEIDATDYYLRTPLMEAAYHGHKGAAKLLLDKGAKKDAKDRHKNIAYDHAVAQDHLDVAELIRAYPRAA